MRKVFSIWVILLVGLSACSSDRHADAVRQLQEAAGANGAGAPPPKVILAPPDNLPPLAGKMSRLVVYQRTGGPIGFVPTVMVAGRPVGKLPQGKALYLDVLPGSWSITLETLTANKINVGVEQGETGYVRIDHKYGSAKRPTLRRVEQEDGRDAAAGRSPLKAG